MKTKTVELVGGPRDGERVEVFEFVKEFQAIHPDGRNVWKETVQQTKKGYAIFLWESK